MQNPQLSLSRSQELQSGQPDQESLSNKSTTCSKCKSAYYLLGLTSFKWKPSKKAAVCVHILYQMGFQSKVSDRAGASFGAGILIKQEDGRTFSLLGESL